MTSLESTPPEGTRSTPPDPDEDTQVLATYDPMLLTPDQRARVRRFDRETARAEAQERAFEATLLRLLRRYGKWLIAAILAAAPLVPLVQKLIAWVWP